jgi:proline iminopeptidase
MSTKLNIILGVTAALVVLAALAGTALWAWMRQPLYTPGMVRAGQNLRAPLDPPAQSGAPDAWNVEADIQLHHFSAGQGRKALVLHGGPGYPFTQPLAGLAPLTDRYEFVYYDQRGSGRSTRPLDRFASQNTWENMQQLDHTLGLGAQIADIERIRRLLGEEKLIVVGHSFGAFLASLYAAEFPERVEALVLVSPAEVLVMPPSSGGLFEAVRGRLPASQQAEYDAFLKRYLDFGSLFSKSEAELQALNAEFGKYYAQVMPVSAVEQGEPGGWMVQALYGSMGRQHDYRAALKAVSAPVLVIHGANDLQSEAASRMYAEAFPNAEFHVIADATHFAFEEQPAAFAALVAEFFEK